MYVLYDGMQESSQDVKIYCPTLKGDFYLSPWFASYPVWDNDNFFFIEGLGNDELRLSTMLEF